MTLKAGKGTRGVGAGWGHRVGGRGLHVSPPPPPSQKSCMKPWIYKVCDVCNKHVLEDVGIYLSTMSIMTLILEFLLVSGYGEPSVLCSQQEVVGVNSSDGGFCRRVAFCNCTHFFGHEWDCKVS